MPGSNPAEVVTNSLNSVSVNGFVSILNDVGNTNSISGSTFNGGLWVSKNVAAPGASHLELTSTTVVGPTIVTNVNGAGGGDTTTSIVNSQLVGQAPPVVPGGLPGGVPAAAGRALVVTNGEGNDKLDVLGSTVIGEPPIFATPGTLVAVNNGNGGSLTTFGPTSGNDTSRVTVYGGVTIVNGANVPGVLDMASFNQADVSGMLAIYNAGGPGATSTMITDANLGSYLAPAGPQLGSPVVVINDSGEDAFAMDSSTAWWGLFINNDDASGGTTPWPSQTSIANSNVGTRPGGPSDVGPGGGALNAALVAEGIVGTNLPGLISPGDALVVGGGTGSDVVNMNPTQVGGQISIILPSGNNSITMLGAADSPLVYASVVISTGNGNDNVRIENINIPVAIDVRLGGGNDTLELAGNTSLPPLNVGSFIINGGSGLDTLDIEDSVTLPVNFGSLLGFITNFNN